MSATPARLLRRSLTVALTAFFVLSLVAVSEAEAQGRRTGHVKHHDSSNPPPGHQKGKGKGHQKEPAFSVSGALINPAAQTAATQAVANVHGMLRSRSFRAERGRRIAPIIQVELVALLDGDGGAARRSLVEALTTRDNADAALEADALVASLETLPQRPDMLPATVMAFNEFVDRSSDAFVLDPPAEFAAIRDVLFSILDPTLEALGEEDASSRR